MIYFDYSTMRLFIKDWWISRDTQLPFAAFFFNFLPSVSWCWFRCCRSRDITPIFIILITSQFVYYLSCVPCHCWSSVAMSCWPSGEWLIDALDHLCHSVPFLHSFFFLFLFECLMFWEWIMEGLLLTFWYHLTEEGLRHGGGPTMFYILSWVRGSCVTFFSEW